MTTPGDMNGSTSATIPTPLRVRWQRFRHRVLPVVVVALCAALAVWLWRRHGGLAAATGEVEARQVAISSGVEGELVGLPGRELDLFEAVQAGDVVARLDGTHLLEQRALRQAELDRLRQQLERGSGGPTTNPSNAPGLDAAAVAKMEEIEAINRKLETLDLKAPFAGFVTRIHRRPGQTAYANQPIVEIASDSVTHVLSYVRQGQRVQPKLDMVVDVQTMSAPRKVFHGRVVAVGVQYTLVPEHQLRDQKTPEWGLPVRIAMPPGTALKPGELVQLSFRRMAG